MARPPTRSLRQIRIPPPRATNRSFSKHRPNPSFQPPLHRSRIPPRNQLSAHPSPPIPRLSPNQPLTLPSVHGNAGTVAQGWRTDTYRSLTHASSSPSIHLLTADYRGFGHSTGTPTEAGLITDGIALVTWALTVARIPASRIVLVGQSLGTAVATAVAEHFALAEGVEFAGLVLVAAFEDVPSLMLTYAIGGVVPILSPLRPYPVLQQFFQRHIQETWYTGARLERFIRSSRKVNLQLVHARNDFDIPYRHSEMLFRRAANATSEEGLTTKEIDGGKMTRELGEGGWVWEWDAGRTKKIRLEVVRYGGEYSGYPLLPPQPP